MAYSERPWDLANVVLDAVVALYSAEFDSTDPEALPARQFVADSAIVAYDCELLAVSLQRLVGAGANLAEVADPFNCLVWRQAEFLVELVRCAPQPTITPTTAVMPSVAEVETNARRVMADAQLLTKAIVGAARDGDLGLGANVALIDWLSIPEQGGFTGGSLRFRVGLV